MQQVTEVFWLCASIANTSQYPSMRAWGVWFLDDLLHNTVLLWMLVVRDSCAAAGTANYPWLPAVTV
jgi:hypothetical protein